MIRLTCRQKQQNSPPCLRYGYSVDATKLYIISLHLCYASAKNLYISSSTFLPPPSYYHYKGTHTSFRLSALTHTTKQYTLYTPHCPKSLHAKSLDIPTSTSPLATIFQLQCHNAKQTDALLYFHPVTPPSYTTYSHQPISNLSPPTLSSSVILPKPLPQVSDKISQSLRGL